MQPPCDQYIGHLFYMTSSFVHHLKPRWIQIGVTVRKRLIRVKIGDFLPPPVILKFDGWPWKTIGHLFRIRVLCYTKLCASFQSHRWIQTGVTVRKRSIRVKIGDFFVPCDLEIWWMALKNNRAPLLCCFKLYALFHNHQWIQTKVTVQKRSIQVKIGDFLSCATLKFDRWPWKKIGHLFYATSRFMHHFIAISGFKLKLQSGNGMFENIDS